MQPRHYFYEHSATRHSKDGVEMEFVYHFFSGVCVVCQLCSLYDPVNEALLFPDWWSKRKLPQSQKHNPLMATTATWYNDGSQIDNPSFPKKTSRTQYHTWQLRCSKSYDSMIQTDPKTFRFLACRHHFSTNHHLLFRAMTCLFIVVVCLFVSVVNNPGRLKIWRQGYMILYI